MLLCSPEEPYVLRLSHLGSLIFDSWKDPIFMQVEILFVTSIEIASFCMPSFDTLFFFFFFDLFTFQCSAEKVEDGSVEETE